MFSARLSSKNRFRSTLVLSVIILAVASIPNRMITAGFFRQWFAIPMLWPKTICFLMPFVVLYLRMLEQIFNGDDGVAEGRSEILFSLFYFLLLVISAMCAVTIVIGSAPGLYGNISHSFDGILMHNIIIDSAAVTSALICMFCANDLHFYRKRLAGIMLFFWGASELWFIFGGANQFGKYVIDITHRKFLPHIAVSVMFAILGYIHYFRQKMSPAKHK